MQTYIVKSGDTLYGIAKKYGVSVSDIRSVNNLKSDNLSLGQIIMIPTEETVALYVVKKGDTLYSIARQYNTTASEIISLNNLKSNNLNINQQLKVPINSPNVNNSNIYIVKSGDNLYSIARKFDTTVAIIKELNNLNTNSLSIGQKLLLPGNDYMESMNDNYQLYIVKSGDTIYNIAQTYGISVNELQAINNLKNTSLSVGQILKIPKSEIELIPLGAECVGNGYIEPNYITYTVKSGDTLDSIALDYGVSVNSIKTLNNLSNNKLSVGQILKIKGDDK